MKIQKIKNFTTIVGLLSVVSSHTFVSASEKLDDILKEEQQKSRVIYSQRVQASMQIEADTFIPNIMGYACQMPAINFPLSSSSGLGFVNYYLKLSHGSYYDYGVKPGHIGLRIHNPNYRFCAGFRGVKEIFGDQYEVGKKILMDVLILRKLVEVSSDGVKKILVESIYVEFLDEIIKSTASINIE